MKTNPTAKTMRFVLPTKSLPNDILVDYVFKYLDVTDILRLRQTSRYFAVLTCHTIVWKRLLESTSSLVPPLLRLKGSPTTEPSAQELKRIVVSAHALDKAWRAPAPALHQWHVTMPWAIQKIALLPGGEYLVASVVDEGNGDDARKEWAIVVYAMDSRSTTVVTPLIWLPIPGVAHYLRARYLCVAGVEGIAVTYVTRQWEDPKYANSGIDIDTYLPAIGYIPWLKHSSHALHIPLSDLRSLHYNATLVSSTSGSLKQQMKHASHICTLLGRIDSPNALSLPSIDIFPLSDTHALVWSILQYPSRLLCKRLDRQDGYTFTIEFSQPGAPYPSTNASHSVQAVKLLPGANKMLVVRHDTHILNVEWHDIPPEIISSAHPPENLPAVIPTRSAFRKFYSGPASFGEVNIIVTPSPESSTLGTIHVYAHASNTPTSPHPGILHLVFPPQPAHTHHFDDAARPHHTTRTSALPVPPPVPIRFGAVESAGPGGVVFVSREHYCSVGMTKEWIDGVRGVQWKLVVPCGGAEGFGRILCIERKGGDNTKRGQDGSAMWVVRRTLGSGTPLDIQMREARSISWDDTTGRLCWVCDEEAKVKVLDLVCRSLRCSYKA